ncbi:hypothetical protein BBJ28_00023499, partial [Nothophytophthora sp. Chile5]
RGRGDTPPTKPNKMPRDDDFYVRYYPLLAALLDRCSVGHRGKFGHEFMEFEFRTDGKLRYANNSNYKKDSMIRKEVGRVGFLQIVLHVVTVSQSVIDEVKRIISDSEITKCVLVPTYAMLRLRYNCVDVAEDS